MDPVAWGGAAWTFLLACAEGCSHGAQDACESFLSLLPLVLPCEKCRAHAARYMEIHPPQVQGPEQMRTWLEDFRSEISQRVAVERSRSKPSLAFAALLLFLVLFLLFVRLIIDFRRKRCA